MSMNLTATDSKGREVPLWQTPTAITWMCLSYNPKTNKPDGGHAGVLRRYIHWVKGTLNGTWESETLEEHREVVREHLAMLAERKGLRFSYT